VPWRPFYGVTDSRRQVHANYVQFNVFKCV
jgi:hypothetical protein